VKKIPQPHGGCINRFEKGDPKPANAGVGKKPKQITQIINELKAQGYEQVKPHNVIDTYETLLALSIEKLVEVGKDDKQPMIVRIVARAMLDNHKGFDIIERMIDRAHGKAQQSVKVEQTTKPEANPLSDKEKAHLADCLDKLRGINGSNES